jgi:hypothetical protein
MLSAKASLARVAAIAQAGCGVGGRVRPNLAID